MISFSEASQSVETIIGPEEAGRPACRDWRVYRESGAPKGIRILIVLTPGDTVAQRDAVLMGLANRLHAANAATAN